MIKTRRSDASATVTFTLDPRVQAEKAAVCGEWNGWSSDVDPMERDSEGGFSLTLDLPSGRSYRFRYLLDSDRWENDWAADAYVPNDFGGDDSVVDLTALADAAPPPAKAPARARSAASKSNGAAKKAAGTAKKASGATKKSAGTKKAAGSTD